MSSKEAVTVGITQLRLWHRINNSYHLGHHMPILSNSGQENSTRPAFTRRTPRCAKGDLLSHVVLCSTGSLSESPMEAFASKVSRRCVRVHRTGRTTQDLKPVLSLQRRKRHLLYHASRSAIRGVGVACKQERDPAWLCQLSAILQ